MSTISIRIASKTNFAKAVQYAKKAGGRFDPATKTWAIPSDRCELNAPGAYGWQIVPAAQASRPTPDTTWMGQASMDHEDSIF